MLTRITDNLRTWRPSVKALAPIDIVRSSWLQIVGPEIAKHCMPSEIRAQTLTILTRSGTWSQQLDFLSAEILAKLAATDASIRVDELRFRVGKIVQQQAHLRLKPQRVQQSLRLAPEASEPVSLSEMIARGKAAAERRALTRIPRCLRCKIPLDTGQFCAPCRHVESQERVHQAMRALSDVPWLSEEDIKRAVPRLGADEYTRARTSLLSRWKRELDQLERKKTFSRGESERATAVAYVMLITGCPPDELTRAMSRHTLGPRLDTLLYGEMPP